MKERRRRGVRGSPIKLQQALDASGLRTQTAVAERIADNEGLDNPPRSLVNKVFQGAQVDARSVQRVATALGVDAWSLYASRVESAAVAGSSSSAGESKPAATDANRQPRPFSRPRRPLAWSVGLAMLVMAMVSWRLWFVPENGSALKLAEVDHPGGIAEISSPQVRRSALVMSEVPDLPVSVVQNALSEQWRVLPEMPAAGTDPQDVLDRQAADIVIVLRSQDLGRWRSLSAYTHRPDAAYHGWQAILPKIATEQRLTYHLRQAAVAIARQRPVSGSSRDAQRKTLVGKHYLDLERTERNVRRALTEFESAIRSDPAYAPAHAGLCEALIAENIRTGQQSRLDEAAPQCDQALRLAADDQNTRRVQAVLDRRRGRPQLAMEGFLRVLKTHPDDVDALLGLGEAYLARYQLGQGDRYYEDALSSARQAQRLEPTFWKTSYLLGRAYYFGGELDQAIAATQQAARASPNVNTLSNLGTFQFCAADFDAAASSYQQIKALQPDSHVPEQQLAAVHYHQRDYQAAVVGFRRALELHEASGAAEDFRIWGNYADSLRMIGSDDALAAYQRAVMLAERLLLEGDARPSRAIAKAYYLEMMHLLDPTIAPIGADALAQLTSEVATADPRFVLLLAVVHAYSGQFDIAEALSRQASTACPGMLQTPDLELAVLNSES